MHSSTGTFVSVGRRVCHLCLTYLHKSALSCTLCSFIFEGIPELVFIPAVMHICTGQSIKMPQTVVSTHGHSRAQRGLVLQIDGSKIFFNLNVNGSEIYRWVLCNYQCTIY